MKRTPIAAAIASLVLAIALVIAAATGACRPSGNDGAGIHGEDAGTPIDIDVMAFLSAARACHHEANVREDSGDLSGAIDALQKLVTMKTPHPGTPIAEVEEVLADAYARLAELRIRAKDLDAAGKDVDAGLAHAKDPTYFRGHLLEVKGVVEEERAKVLDAAGKKDEAKEARARAIKLFDEVVGIQMKVIDKTLGDGGAK